MSDRQVGETTRTLMQAKALISDGKKWLQGRYKDGHGRYCAVGAVMRARDAVRDPNWREICSREVDLLDHAARGVRPAYLETTRLSATALNDGACHSDVMAMFDRAIALSMQQEKGK